MLPRVRILFSTGNIGAVSPSQDGVCGLICTAVAVTDKLVLQTAYLLTSLDDLTTLGVTGETADANAHLYKVVSEFYTEAPEGTNLWIYGVADTVTLAAMVDTTGVHGKGIINAANGAISILMLSKKDAAGYTPTVTDGIDADVTSAMTNAQALTVWATDSKFAPLFVIIPARHYAGTASALADLGTGAKNRVCILIGDTLSGSKDAAVGLLAGRYAAIPVQRSAARVKSGAIGIDNLYIGSSVPELGNPDVINDAGYITFRNFIGKAGYFFTDDKLATSADDDYALVPRRRSIDKAYRIAYRKLVDELGDDVPVTETGTMPYSIAKSIESALELEIENTMGVDGELGANPDDPNDTGVTCFIDPDQDIVSTNKFEAHLRIKPFGYPKYIDLMLGFSTTTA